MNDQNKNGQNSGQNGGLGVAFGAFLLLAAVLFIATGGSLGGKKTIENDRDLPPVATGAAPNSAPSPAPSPATTTGQSVR